MGIVSCIRDRGNRAGQINNLWQREFDVGFVIVTDNVNVGPIAVRTAVGMTGSWYTNGLLSTDPNYEFDSGSFVQSISVKEDGDSGVQWKATVHYGPLDTSQFGSDPTLWPIKVSFGGERTEKVIYFDNAGNRICNSALDPFDPPITIDDSRVLLNITRNERVSTFGISIPSTYNDTTNNATWNGFPAYACKFGTITTSEPQYDSNGHVYYLTVTYPVTVNRDLWVKNLLDCGMNALDTSSPPRPTPIMNNGQQISEPVPLDGSGHRMASTGTPTTLPFDVYTAVDWTPLALDLSLRLGH